MTKTRFGAVLALASAAALGTASAHAQAAYTATQALHISAFGGATGIYTGVDTAKNLAITAGVNFTFGHLLGLEPSLTVRGTYPVDKGADVGEKTVLGGLQVERKFGRFHPYADALVGRGELNFSPPHPDPTGSFYYEVTSSYVISPGAGVDVDLSPHFALKFDGQFQRFKTPVVASGDVWAKSGTAGITYRFDFNNRRRHWR